MELEILGLKPELAFLYKKPFKLEMTKLFCFEAMQDNN